VIRGAVTSWVTSWLASVLLLVAGAASASPAGRGTAAPGGTGPGEHPAAAAAAPAPDGTVTRGRPGPADRRRTVSLLDVRIEGLPDDVKDSFRHQLEEQIDTKRYWLADREYMRRLLLPSTKWTDGCLVGHCLTAIRASGAELVLLAALTGSGTSFGYVVTLIRTDTGQVIDQESDRCDVCRVNEVIRGATLAAVDLLNKAPDQLSDEAAEQAARVDRAIGPLQGELAERDHHATRIGIALLAIGLVGAITGGALYLVDDSRPSYAIATATGGLAMAAGGVVVLTF
jgi:hypothetical protein